MWGKCRFCGLGDVFNFFFIGFVIYIGISFKEVSFFCSVLFEFSEFSVFFGWGWSGFLVLRLVFIVEKVRVVFFAFRVNVCFVRVRWNCFLFLVYFW